MLEGKVETNTSITLLTKNKLLHVVYYENDHWGVMDFEAFVQERAPNYKLKSCGSCYRLYRRWKEECAEGGFSRNCDSLVHILIMSLCV